MTSTISGPPLVAVEGYAWVSCPAGCGLVLGVAPGQPWGCGQPHPDLAKVAAHASHLSPGPCIGAGQPARTVAAPGPYRCDLDAREWALEGVLR